MPDLPENRFASTTEWIQLAATSSGRGIQICDLNQHNPQEPLKFKLIPEALIHGRVLNLEGRPVAGVDVRVIEVSAGEETKIDAWYAEAVKNDDRDLDEEKMLFGQKPSSSRQRDQSAGATFQSSMRTTPEVFSPAKTDANGRFVLSGIGKDHLAILQISGTGLVRTLVNVVTRSMKPVKDFSGGSQLSGWRSNFLRIEFQIYCQSRNCCVRSEPFVILKRKSHLPMSPCARIRSQEQSLPVTGS